MRLLVVNGPNLNLLGIREVGVYGSLDYATLMRQVEEYASARGVETAFFQSNHEGAILDYLQSHYKEADGIVINPGALTHYSYALYDCLKALPIPAVEVHLSNIHEREPFRKLSVIKDACVDQISGKGVGSYFEGIDRIRRDIQP
jgi:3-dehydroquinate dehydratase II